MKREDIDKKIGLPDVDAEWAKFEREVVNQKTASRKSLYWGIGIAASIALVAGIFLFGNEEKEQTGVAVAKVEQPVAPSIHEEEETAIETESATTAVQRPNANMLAMATPSKSEVNEATEAETVYDCGEVMPCFPGGEQALRDFIKTNMRYPELAMEYGARGRVITTFLVDSTGQVSNFKVFRYMRMSYDTLRLAQETGDRQQIKEQIAQQLGEESIRILSLMPRWTPGNQFGRPVNVKYNLPIAFNVTDAERETYLAQKRAADDELQALIAGQTIVPTSADLGDGNAMRLHGIRITGSDSVRIGRKVDYDFLAVVDGQPLSEAEQERMLSSFHVYFFHRQQFVDSIMVYKDENAKRPFVEKYGDRARNAVMAVTTVPDTLCDAYIQQHPELMQTRRRVEGYVVDEETKEPLPDTWIHCCGDGGDDTAGAATDSTGHFVLWLPRTDVMLQASRVGYINVRITHPADTVITIRMKSNVRIKEVEVLPRDKAGEIRSDPPRQ